MRQLTFTQVPWDDRVLLTMEGEESDEEATMKKQ